MTLDPKRLSEKDFDDYEFICREGARLAAMEPQALFEHFRLHPEDRFHWMPRPRGGELFLSRQADLRFLQIATRGLLALGTDREKHSLEKVVGAVKSELVSRLDEPSKITDENAHDVFRAAIQALAVTHSRLTHFIPCTVVVHEVTPRFRIGPVEFALRSLFMHENESQIRRRKEGPQGSDLGFEQLEKFFSRFRWIAHVAVEPCDAAVSTQRARRAVQMALDLFKLYVGSSRASCVRQGYDLGIPTETAELVSDEPHGFSILWGRRIGDAIVNDNWFRQVSVQKPWQEAESLISRALSTWGEVPEPEQRFLDALAWHGEAVTDPEPQSRVLKFWIAIERVASLHSGVSVAKRAALLSCNNPEEFEGQLSKCNSLYSKRSAVSHGALGRESATSLETASRVEMLSRTALAAYLMLLERLQKRGDMSKGSLEVEFEQLEKICRKGGRRVQERKSP